MFDIKKAGRFASVATLAASTALAGPISAYAADRNEIRVAQADVEVPPPPPPAAPEAAPAQSEEGAVAAEEPVAEEPAVEEASPSTEAPAEPAVEESAAEPVAEEPADVAPEAPVAPLEEPTVAPEPEPETQPETQAAPEPEPEAAAPAEEAAQPAPAEEPVASDPAPAEEAAEPSVDTTPATPEDTAAEDIPSEEAPAAPDAPAATQPDAAAEADAAAESEPVAPAEAESDANADAAAESEPAATDAPLIEEAPATDETPPTEEPAEELPQDMAPTAPSPAAPAAPGESTTEESAPAQQPAARRAAPPEEQPEAVAEDLQTEEVPQGGVAASDARVQTLSEPVGDIPSANAEAGERIDATTINNSTVTDNSTTTNNTTVNNSTVVRGPQPEIPPGLEVVERDDDDGREILTILGAGLAGAAAGAAAAYFIRSDDTQRLAVDSNDQFYERLGDGRIRETIVRENGTQVVTVSNRYGETIQRSRILPDGREVVLFYDPYAEESDGQQYYYDVGADLPPLQYTIPESDYIVDPAQPDQDLYYRTIVAPPVETVERIYSVDEVRRSERIRDKVRRIDLNTINFAFGSADISQEQVGNLEALANAISDVIDQNPAETFLIEGHTDAVGSDLANLKLSDRRAETVASSLTSYFDVPPENLITQGYGEQFLKVQTQDQSAENRRVTVRRITPLVKPVETSSAQ